MMTKQKTMSIFLCKGSTPVSNKNKKLTKNLPENLNIIYLKPKDYSQIYYNHL